MRLLHEHRARSAAREGGAGAQAPRHHPQSGKCTRSDRSARGASLSARGGAPPAPKEESAGPSPASTILRAVRQTPHRRRHQGAVHNAGAPRLDWTGLGRTGLHVPTHAHAHRTRPRMPTHTHTCPRVPTHTHASPILGTARNHHLPRGCAAAALCQVARCPHARAIPCHAQSLRCLPGSAISHTGHTAAPGVVALW